MTARQPRRSRRRLAPAAALPRPANNVTAELEGVVNAPTTAAPTTAASRGSTARRGQPRDHHVTNDYSYVRKDLVTVAAVGVVVVGFIVGMSYVV
jgi:hypothetical protein